MSSEVRNNKTRNISFVVAVVLLVGGFFILKLLQSEETTQTEEVNEIATLSQFENSGLNVDFTQTSIDLEQVLSGGPGKDGIPALTDPGFVQQSEAEISDTTQVIFVEHNGDMRIYPYNILVWHEIVNDVVGGEPLTITFCPLCGSAIVFESTINGQVTEFGVSGYLYESNLLMYDRSDSESLWSQSRGEAVAGNQTGTQLEHFPFRLMTYLDATAEFPDAVVLSENTGFNRDYTGNPYSGYDDSEQTYFPVSSEDKRYPAKEVFYIVPLQGTSIAVRQDKEDGVYRVPDTDVTVTFDKGRITANWGDAELPGYYEMWFSWATHNQDFGIVL